MFLLGRIPLNGFLTQIDFLLFSFNGCVFFILSINNYIVFEKRFAGHELQKEIVENEQTGVVGIVYFLFLRNVLVRSNISRYPSEGYRRPEY